MTERLFETDPTLRVFYAKVISAGEMNGHYFAELDRTAFYPEGGGQPSDKGTLSKKKVLEVHEKNGRILHYLEEPISEGSYVEGRVDDDRRTDYTVQHSAEHIVSGLIHRRFGYDNVGFHMGAETVQIDFNGMLTEEDVFLIETLANEYVRRDIVPVIRFYDSEDDVDDDYRSKKELTGRVRIVEFPDADRCACCGTHVSRTGEIGLIKLINLSKVRSGVRIELMAGKRAFDYLNRIYMENRSVSRLLSAKPFETSSAVSALLNDRDSLKSRIIRLNRDNIGFLAASADPEKDIFMATDTYDPDYIRELSVALMDKTTGTILVTGGNDDTGYRYCLGKRDGNIRELTKELNSLLSGRGGGKDAFFSQGSFKCTLEELEDAVKDRLEI